MRRLKLHAVLIGSSCTLYKSTHTKSIHVLCRSGAGSPVVNECEGEYRYDNRKNILEWRLPVIDSSNKTGSMELTIGGHANDFFPVNVSFVSKRLYCDIEVCTLNTILFVCWQDEQRVCKSRALVFMG